MDPPRREPLRPGRLLPALVVCAGLLDAAGRLVPLEKLAFRTWEAATVAPAPGGPFQPGRRFSVAKAFGDLASLGNRLDLAERRPEVLTTDAWGLRNSAETLGSGPAEALLFGDSFIGGAGVSDEETLAAQLHALTGRTVRDASGRLLTNPALLREMTRRYGLERGWIVFGGVGPRPLPVFPLHEWRVGKDLPGPEPGPSRLEGLMVSRLAIVLSRLHRAAVSAAGVPGSPDVAVRRLPGGEELLFLRKHEEIPARTTPEALETWRLLRERLEKQGLRAAFVLVPCKAIVYGPLTSPPAPDARALEAQLRTEAAALRQAGFVVVDATDALVAAASEGLPRGERVFWRDDTHWNPRGIRIVARELAVALGWAPPDGTPAAVTSGRN